MASERVKQQMPSKPQKVPVIGSGPIVIGQAAEFDYAGAQACTALREVRLDREGPKCCQDLAAR